MDYKELYECSNILRQVYDNILQINSLGLINDGKLMEDLNKLDKQLNNFENIPNNINTNAASISLSKENKEIELLYKLSSSLLEFTRELLSYFKIYENAKKIKKMISDTDLDSDNLKGIVELFRYDLNNYAKLKKYGEVDYSNLEYAYDVIYKIIKMEYRQKGSSTLYNEIKSLNLHTQYIDELINIDAKNMNISSDNIDELILNVSIHENEFIDSIKNELDFKKAEYNDAVQKEEEILSIKKEVSKNKFESRKDITKTIAGTIGKIIPLILSLTVVISANVKTIKEAKEKVMQSVEYYNTEDGHYSKKDIALERLDTSVDDWGGIAAKEGDILLKVYGKTRTDGKRDLTVYKISEELDNIEDYLNVDLNDQELLYKENINATSDEYAFLPTDEFSEVAIINESYFNGISLVHAFLIFIIYNILACLIDIVLSLPSIKLDYPTLFIYLIGLIESYIPSYYIPHNIIKDCISDVKDVIDTNNTLDNKKYSKKELKELKDKISKIIKEYETLFENYSYLEKELSKDGYTKKLK